MTTAGGGPSSSSLADVIDTILDKGLVTDAYVRVSLVGIELLTIDARVVVASVDTPDARDRLRACIDHGVASGPDDELVRLLFECWPRSLRDAKAAALDSSLTERQIAVYYGILVIGQTQGHFTLTDPPRLLAANFVAMEDGYQMEVLAGRRSRAEVIASLHSYARAATGHDLNG